MRRILGALVLVLASAACSPAEQQGTTTTEQSSDTSTTSAPSTTTSSSTSTSTTTTTLAPTTTTLLTGNWADQPVISSAGWDMALGWWDGSTWVQAEEGMTLAVEGGEDYQIAVLESAGGLVTGSAQVRGCDFLPWDYPGIELSQPSLLARTLGIDVGRPVSGVAISAPWDLTPHHVSPGEAHPDLEAIALDLLSERGFVTDSVAIVQTVDADLEGDGAIETLVVVEDTELANEASAVYSLVFLVGLEISEPFVVDESVIPAAESGFPSSFRVGAVADLNGDGVMEVVLDGLAWENEWVTVYEMTDDGIVERIGAGCGV